MKNNTQKKEITERRSECFTKSDLWEKLNLAQKFAANGLINFGYSLDFIRITGDGLLAILRSDRFMATINIHGEVDTSPSIEIREN